MSTRRPKNTKGYIYVYLYLENDQKKESCNGYFCPVENKYFSQNQKTYVPSFSPKYFTMLGKTWTISTQQANKLLATNMDIWRIVARKSRKESSEMLLERLLR
jgi:hypothetical protein